jgi:hypothetical protein
MRPRPLLLLAFTCAFDGVRAGAGTFRALLDLPARSQIGPVAFAELSRATDLSPRGVAFYALYGAGGLVLTAATAWVVFRARAPKATRRLTLLAALSSVAILLLTLLAAPLMWRIGSSPNDPMLLADLEDRFVALTIPRIVLADLSFLATLSALVRTAWPEPSRT